MNGIVQTMLVTAALGMAGQPAGAQTAERMRYEPILLEQFPDYRPIRQEEFSSEALHDVFGKRERPADPGLLIGKFNGDHYPDFAALIAHRLTDAERKRFPDMESDPYPDAHQTLLVACLSRGPEKFDCQPIFSYTSMLGTPPKCKVAIWKEKPERRLEFSSLWRLTIDPKNGAPSREEIKNWREHTRVMGVTPIPGAKPEEDSFASVGYIRQRYESIWAMPQFGYLRQAFWVPHAGLIECCE